MLQRTTHIHCARLTFLHPFVAFPADLPLGSINQSDRGLDLDLDRPQKPSKPHGTEDRNPAFAPQSNQLHLHCRRMVLVVWCCCRRRSRRRLQLQISNWPLRVPSLFSLSVTMKLIDWWDDVWNERFSMNYLSIDLCLEMQFYIKYHWSKNKKICDRNGSELRSIPVHKSSKKHDIDWNQSHFLTDERCKVHSWILAILCDHRASDLSAEC